MPDILSKKLTEKIEATDAAFLEARGRMIAHHLSDPEAYQRALHDLIEAEAARLAYCDAFFMVTGRKYVEIDS